QVVAVVLRVVDAVLGAVLQLTFDALIAVVDRRRRYVTVMNELGVLIDGELFGFGRALDDRQNEPQRDENPDEVDRRAAEESRHGGLRRRPLSRSERWHLRSVPCLVEGL